MIIAAYLSLQIRYGDKNYKLLQVYHKTTLSHSTHLRCSIFVRHNLKYPKYPKPHPVALMYHSFTSVFNAT
jgi:hypothetical protein